MSKLITENSKVKRWKTTEMLCEQYDVSPVTIWRWVSSGRLKKPKKINGRNRWEPDAEPLFDDEVEK